MCPVVSLGISCFEFSLPVTRELLNCNKNFQDLSCTKIERGIEKMSDIHRHDRLIRIRGNTHAHTHTRAHTHTHSDSLDSPFNAR
jgi:hypothetical protein